MTGTGILTEIISILVGAITGIAEGVGTGLSTLAQAIFLTTEGGLSVFGTLIVVFAGISLAIGFHWLPYIVICIANFLICWNTLRAYMLKRNV